jgi:predicted AAA+ superfamily ATPase
MENIIYNELLYRGYNVDIGIVEYNVVDKNKKVRKQLEIDFVCNLGSKRYYIQSAFSIPDEEKMRQEKESLIRVNDSFKKVIVVRDDIKPWRTEEGILVIGIQDFLLNDNSLEL